MLVLTRRTGERLVFEVGSVRFAVWPHSTRDGSVRLAIDAPDVVTVNREELCEQPWVVSEPKESRHGRDDRKRP